MSELQHTDVDGSDYLRLLAGHPGHLTASQEKSLEAFKQNLQEANLYNPVSDDHGHPSHDDTTLLYVLGSLITSDLVDTLTDTGDSSVPGSLMLVKRRNSLLIPVPGERSTM